MSLNKDSKNILAMPLVGFGTYQLSVEQAQICVKDALIAGFRHIDSAEGYNNEVGTGKGIKDSGVKREKIFVTTKLFPGYSPWGSPDKDFQTTIENLKRQLTELQLDYVDLYLIHAPMSELRLQQWEALIELKEMGLAKHIGVSNYSIETLTEISKAGLMLPEANQVEFHPICNRESLTRYMLEHKIAPIAYSSLAPLSSWRVEEGQGGEVLADIKKEGQLVIGEIAKAHEVSEAKVLLRWGLQSNYAVLTKSSKPERIRENLELFDFELTDDEMQRLNNLNQNQAIAWAANGLDPMQAVPVLKK